ncbi:MAG: TetR/AcrR family transcriptional regulator [Acidobacteriia bacterium]|nr:TetR/AcrR family transcriptional regulator [Terriglobia bacterium]
MRKPPYHHGNLRAVLLQTAMRLIREVGPAGFTLREVARRANVSHNAPYRHFRNKDQLLAAVATEGFRELTAAMRTAAESQPSAWERLRRSGLAYISFAVRRPEHFTVMFDTPLNPRDDPVCAKAGEEAFGTLLSFIAYCQRQRELPPGDPLPLALVAWSLVHGIGKLANANRFPFHSKTELMKFSEKALDGALGGMRRKPG